MNEVSGVAEGPPLVAYTQTKMRLIENLPFVLLLILPELLRIPQLLLMGLRLIARVGVAWVIPPQDVFEGYMSPTNHYSCALHVLGTKRQDEKMGTVRVPLVENRLVLCNTVFCCSLRVSGRREEVVWSSCF